MEADIGGYLGLKKLAKIVADMGEIFGIKKISEDSSGYGGDIWD